MKSSPYEESNFSFPQRTHKIRHFKDFRRLAKEGKSYTLSFGAVKVMRNNMNLLRIAISIRKKFSKKSTKRNRLKRVLTELFRLNKHKLKGYDIWVQVKTKAEPENILEEVKRVIGVLH